MNSLVIAKQPAAAHASGGVLVSGRDLSLSFGDRAVLEHIDIAIAGGEIVTLIGPNGAGKSTLVKLLLGIGKPDSGTIRRAAGLRIGYVPQLMPLEPVLPLTVARLMRLTMHASRDEVLAALSETGVAHLVDASAHTLSGGERQRVLLARALLRAPDLLVLDEPCQGVDFAGQAELYRLIGRIRDRRGCGILIVSHDLHLVVGAADRVLCLNRHICCSGTPEGVAQDPEYLKLFGAQAAEAFGVYTHGHDHHHDVSGEVVPHEEGCAH